MSEVNDKDKEFRKIQVEKQKKIMLMVGVAAVVVALIIILVALFGGNMTASTKGYKSPKKAIEAYVTAVAKGDYEKALEVYDSQERAENIDLVKYTEKMQCFIADSMPAPALGEYPAVNKVIFDGEAASQLKIFTYSLQSGKTFQEGFQTGNVAIGDAYSADQLVKDLDPKNLKSLEVEQVDIVDKATQESERYTSNNKEVCKIYGCKDIKDYAALMKRGKTYYVAYFSLGKYENGWKIQNMNSAMAETTQSGAASQTTKEDYKKLISSK